jgi:hypothetical protein
MYPIISISFKCANVKLHHQKTNKPIILSGLELQDISTHIILSED